MNHYSYRRATLSIIPFVLLAANLRPAITSVGPLIGPIRETTGMSLAAAGLLNSLPLVAFAAFAPLAAFGRRHGIERVLVAALVILVLGILLRSSGSATGLFIGTALLAAGIAVGNVLMPGIIKRDFPDRMKGMTTVYAVTLGLSAAAGSGLAYPLSTALPGGWQAALAIWAVPAVLAALAWLPAARLSERDVGPGLATVNASAWRSPVGWFVTAFMGMQSLYFYVAIAWLPTILQGYGYEPSEAGGLITLFQLVALAMSAMLPLLLRRGKNQSVPALTAALTMSASTVCLVVFPAGAYLWMVLLGLGGGACLPLALAFIGLRSADHHQAASLSMMAQSLGYLFAALGPVTFGLLRDLSGGWTLPLILLSVLGLFLAVVGYEAGRDRAVS